MAPRQRNISNAAEEEASSEPLLKEKEAPQQRLEALDKTEADIARDRHDYFNLVALIPIIVTTYFNYEVSPNLEVAYTGAYFWPNYVCTALYFLADFLWVACVPICVKSPDLIMKHHAVAGVLLFLPYFYPEYRWLTGIVLSVEINTWFLILRRVVYKSATPENPVNPVVGFTVSALFYSSWIIIRCVVYPAVLMKAFSLAKEVIEETGTWMHLPIVFIPFHAMLCVLNIKWTYDLFTPIVRQWMGTAPKTVGVSNGL